MIKWEALTVYQKAAFWIAIGIVGWFSPEIALLFHFGGIEVVFAFIAIYSMPIIRLLQSYLSKAREIARLVYCTCQSSASAQQKVFFVQSAFCTAAFMLTGSIAFSAMYFMPGLVLNGFLI